VPGPRAPAPLQTLAWIAAPGPFLRGARARYGDTFALELAYAGRWVVVCHPDAVREVFGGDQDGFHAGEANRVLRPLLGSRSILLLDDEPHLRRRRLLGAALQGARPERREESMRNVAERELATLPVGRATALLPRLQAITLEVIMHAVLGAEAQARAGALRGALADLLRWCSERRALAALLLLGPERTLRHSALPRLLARVDEQLYAQIALSRSDPRLHEREDVLAALLRAREEHGEPIADADVRDQLITLLVAGHETTAAALAWAVERLLRAPAVLARLRGELAAGQPAYLDAVCRETLRLWPVLPIAGRRLARPARLGGHELQAGTNVAACIYLLHRRADLYPEPERFRPERFLQGAPDTYAWIPFGGGARRCLGGAFALAEMRAVLAAIVTGPTLRPSRARGERVRRRALIWAPARGAEVVRRP
jgi:cytochrome P450